MRRRLAVLILAAGITTLLYWIFLRDSDTSFALSASHQPHPNNPSHFVEPVVESTSPIPNGVPKPPGSNYTRALVLARTRKESTWWVNNELADMLDTNLLKPYIYYADDLTAPLHPPKNKGHEAMIYLTYLIDHYDDALPDIIIFMHGHKQAWHNNELLNLDAVEMVRRLSPQRVTRLGYMNLRCHWEPGCPDWISPKTRNRDGAKKEERVIGAAWKELFPTNEVPDVLGQACCSQFAVSRERVLMTAKERFVELREWLVKTTLSDELSGRVFEWVWQYIFTKAPVDCPSMRACYCDGYGVCFASPEEFDRWFELKWNFNRYKEESELRSGVGKVKTPEYDAEREAFLTERMVSTMTEMNRLQKEALHRGRDPSVRALAAGRPWKEGDGF